MLQRYLPLLASLTLFACAGPYPHPVTYLSPSDVPPTVLPEPTVRGSDAYEAEIQQMISMQKSITPRQQAMMNEDMKVIPEMVALPVLGKNFNRTRLPVTYALLDKVGSDNWRISDVAKNFYNTKRPFLEDDRIGMKLAEPIYIPAYPSGHTTASAIWAETLSMLLPNYSRALHARADEVALARVRAGVHWPHDVAGGKYLVSKEVELLKTNAKFQADLQEARKELRNRGWLKGSASYAEDPDARFIKTYLETRGR